MDVGVGCGVVEVVVSALVEVEPAAAEVVVGFEL
jgi:hypothetical protein